MAQRERAPFVPYAITDLTLHNSKTGIITYLLQIVRWLSYATRSIGHVHTNKNLFMEHPVELWLKED